MLYTSLKNIMASKCFASDIKRAKILLTYLLKNIFFTLFFVSLFSCGAQPKKDQNVGASNLWISDSFKTTRVKEKNIKVYVRHLDNGGISTNIADYFLIVHEGEDYLRSGMIARSNPNYYKKDLGIKNINGHNFSVSIKVFNSVSRDKGEYYSIINSSIYSAPTCGLLKEYIAQDKQLKLSLVDAVSCGQLGLEMGVDDYKDEFRKRISELHVISEYAFGYQ